MTLLEGEGAPAPQAPAAPAAAPVSTAPSALDGGAPAPQTTWRDGLPDDLKANPSLAVFTDVGALAKSFLHQQQFVGKKGVLVPSETDSPEAWANFSKSIGVPDLPQYDLKPPKDAQVNEPMFNKFKEIFQKNGVLPRQAQAVVDSYIAFEQETLKQSMQQKQQKSQQALADLKREWGEGFEKETAAARVAAKQIGDDFVKYLKESGLADDPQVVKALAKFGKLYGEDKLRGEAGSGPMGKTQADLDKEIAVIESDPDYMNPMSRNFTLLNQKRTSLYQQRYSGNMANT